MKKLFLIFILLFFFTGCGAMDEEPMMCDEGYVLHDGDCIIDNLEEITIYSNLTYDLNHLSFNSTLQTDILYDTFDDEEDYLLITSEVLGLELTEFELETNTKVLSDVYIISTSEYLSVESVLDLELSEYTVKAASADIVVTPQDVLTFNAIQLRQEEMKSFSGRYYTISKIDYLESKLDTTLTNQQLDDLEELQQLIVDIDITTGMEIEISEYLFSEFIFILEEYYDPDEILVIVDLEEAYNLIRSLHEE